MLKILASLKQMFSRRRPMIVLLPLGEPETVSLTMDQTEMEQAFQILNSASLNADNELVLTVPPELQHLNLDQWMLLAETLRTVTLEQAHSPRH